MWKRKGDKMKAVYEEKIGHLAVFIVEDLEKTFHIPLKELPNDANTGDVFLVEVLDNHLRLLKNLPDERDQRLKANRLKREELLRRKKLP